MKVLHNQDWFAIIVAIYKLVYLQGGDSLNHSKKKYLKVVATVLALLLVVNLSPGVFTLAASGPGGGGNPPPAPDVNKIANWIDTDVPTAEVTLSVVGKERDVKSDIIILLDRSYSMDTAWCVREDHYYDEVVNVEATYEVRVSGDPTWHPVTSWLTIRMTVHDDGTRTPTLAGLSVSGYDTEFNGSAITAYRKGPGSDSWEPDDWDEVENAEGNPSAEARIYLREFILSLLGSSAFIASNYPYMSNITTTYLTIRQADVNDLNGCQTPLMLGVEASLDLANFVLPSTDNNIAMISFGPSIINGKYVNLWTEFSDQYIDWQTKLANPLVLDVQRTGNTRYAMALMSAKFYLASQGDYELIDPATSLPYTTSLALYDINSAAFDADLADPTSTLWNMLNDGILRCTSNDRVPYIVVFSSVMPLLTGYPFTYEHTGFTVDTTGIEVHGLGFAANGPEVNDTLRKLTEGYKTNRLGSQQTPNYPGHNYPRGSASYKVEKGSYFRMRTGSDFTLAFDTLQRNLRKVGLEDAVITDVIADGFVLDQSRPITPINADYSYDSTTRTLTWYLGSISMVEATLTYYVKAVPPAPSVPPDPSDLSPLDPKYVIVDDINDPNSYLYMLPNESAVIEYTDIDDPTQPQTKDFPDPELKVEKIEYSVEYYQDGQLVDTVVVTGYNTPLEDTIPFDDSLADKDKYLPDYKFDRMYVNSDLVNNAPDNAADKDVIKLYYKTPLPEGFKKVATNGAALVQGENIRYELSFDLPANVAAFSSVRIEDDIPVGLTYQSATIKIGAGPEVDVTGLIDLVTAPGKASYTLTDLPSAAGMKVVLAVTFKVDSVPADGYIVNNGAVFYKPATGDPEVPGGEDESIVVEIEKTANPGTFTMNGEEIDYTISFTLPDKGLDDYESVRIEDVIPPTLSLVGTTGALTVGTSSSLVVQLDTATAGAVSYSLAGNDLQDAAGKTINLTLKFAISGWTSGPILNIANLYFTPKGGDEELGGKNDITISPQSQNSINVNITAKKNIDGASGGVLTAGLFEFELLRNGQHVATTTNDKDGNIVFTITYTVAGTYNYIMREVQKAGNDDWIIDETTQALTVTVTDDNGVLSATVDRSPTFTNTYSPGRLSLSIRKELLNANGDPVEAGKQFEVKIYTYAEYQKGENARQPFKTVTLSANGANVVVDGLRAKEQYVLAETQVANYITVGFTVNDGGVSTVNNSTSVRLDIAPLSQDKTLIITVTNRPGTTNNNDTTTNTYVPPPITIVDDGPPLVLFISDHVAYIIGYPEGDVRPQRNITRAEVTTVFFRLLTDELRTANWSQANTYPDVLAEHWFNNAISVMSKMGIVLGYPDGTFKPNGAITRGELATIAARFARQMKAQPINTRTFSDIAGHWAEEDILYAAAIGWVNGYPDGTYLPNQPITRAEFMTLVNRMLERVPETTDDLLPDMVQWEDNANPNAWYYLAVQEATTSHVPIYKTGAPVPGLAFNYEKWEKLAANRDWAQLEKTWSTANSG